MKMNLPVLTVSIALILSGCASTGDTTDKALSERVTEEMGNTVSWLPQSDSAVRTASLDQLLPVEAVQALVDESQLSNPRRVALGPDAQRLAMLLAVLHRHGGIPLGDQDVFVNVVGGMRVSETAADLAVILAALSSFRDKPLGERLIIFGEVGLAGEIRPVPGGEERLAEAAKHGFTRACSLTKLDHTEERHAPRRRVNVTPSWGGHISTLPGEWI